METERPSLVARNVTRGTLLAGQIEAADGLWGRFMGLMGRPSLAAEAGLWLPGTNGIHMMFMRFPIDAVFLGRPQAGGGGGDRVVGGGERVVLSVHAGLRAWTGLVPLVRGAEGVLELPVGTIERTGTVVGDRVVLELAARG